MLFGACSNEDIAVEVPGCSQMSIQEKYELLNEYMDVNGGQWTINLSEKEAAKMGLSSEYQERTKDIIRINKNLKKAQDISNSKICFFLKGRYITVKNGQILEESEIKTKSSYTWIPANAYPIAEIPNVGYKELSYEKGPDRIYYAVESRVPTYGWTCYAEIRASGLISLTPLILTGYGSGRFEHHNCFNFADRYSKTVTIHAYHYENYFQGELKSLFYAPF